MKRILALLLLAAGADAAAATEVRGDFDVMLSQQDVSGGMGRYLMTKRFRGPLYGTSRGMMLSAGDQAQGQAGYVAMEVVTGAIGTREGSFALQHSGVMGNGQQSLSISIVPGSGTGALQGIRGTMTISVEAGGAHHYVLNFDLPSP